NITEGTKLPFQLESLSISSNLLEGGIPKSFGNACALSTLDMSDNNLSDELSLIIHHLSGCAKYLIKELHLEGNHISVGIFINCIKLSGGWNFKIIWQCMCLKYLTHEK
ncbi:hypothetical protein VIGAN_11124300, partial [Vigna angularis var. angularis]